MIITAKVANKPYNLVNPNYEEYVRQLRRIESAIIRAWKNDKSFIVYNHYIDDVVVETLAQNGYIVKDSSTYKITRFVISW